MDLNEKKEKKKKENAAMGPFWFPRPSGQIKIQSLGKERQKRE